MENLKGSHLGNTTQKPNGEYVCQTCGAHIDFDGRHNSPVCPTCGGITFVSNNSETYFT